MTDAEKIEKAKRAVAHILNRIREDEGTRIQIGWGTQSFSLLTEAAAALFDEPVEKVRDTFSGVTPEVATQGTCSGDYGYCDAHGYH